MLSYHKFTLSQILSGFSSKYSCLEIPLIEASLYYFFHFLKFLKDDVACFSSHLIEQFRDSVQKNETLRVIEVA